MKTISNSSRPGKKRRLVVPVVQIYFDDHSKQVREGILELSRVTGLSVSEIGLRMLSIGYPIVTKALRNDNVLPLGD